MKLQFSEVLGRAQKVITSYPLTLLAAGIMTIAAIYLIESDYTSEDTNYFVTKIMIVASLGISVSFGLKMLSQRNPKFSWLELLLLPFLIGYYFILPAKWFDFTEVYTFLLIPSYLLAHLLVAIIPYLKKENTENDFWEYNKKLFVNFFLTLIFTGVLCAGVELAIVAVDNLFNMDFQGDIYFETFIFFLIFGSCFIFLLFSIGGLDALEKKAEFPVVLKFFTQFILIPLLICYALILYLYTLKIIINWELPRGWVSYLVLAYSMLGILALLLVFPLKDETEKSWVRLFSKIFYYSLFPLLILLFVAIFTRVLEYGFTEARYFVLLLAVWLTLITFYFVFYKRATIKFIPVSLFLFGFFALVFPFLNAFSVAKYSQKKDLMRILTENNLLKDGKINFNQEVDYETVEAIEDKFEFLDERHQTAYLYELLPDDFTKPKQNKRYRYWNLYREFSKVNKTAQVIETDSDQIRLTNSESVFETAGYDYFVQPNRFNSDYKDLKIGEDILNIIQTNQSFKLKLNNKESVDLTPQIKELFKNKRPSFDDYETDDLSIVSQLGNYRIKIIFSSINLTQSNKKDSFYFQPATLLIKKTD